MRNVYTAPMVMRLIDADVRPGWIGGISAGATHASSFAARDSSRARDLFLKVPQVPGSTGTQSWLRGNGYFNADVMYSPGPIGDAVEGYDFATMKADPTPLVFGSCEAATGRAVYWGKPDMTDPERMMLLLRASSTLPMLMPPTIIDGVAHVDGAFGESGGIPLEAAEAAGFERFLVVLTRPRGYRKPPVSRRKLTGAMLRKYPAVRDGVLARPTRYNATMERLESLEREGRAYLFAPTGLLVEQTELRQAKLRASYEAGRRQTATEWPAIEEFLRG